MRIYLLAAGGERETVKKFLRRAIHHLSAAAGTSRLWPELRGQPVRAGGERTLWGITMRFHSGPERARSEKDWAHLDRFFWMNWRIGRWAIQSKTFACAGRETL